MSGYMDNVKTDDYDSILKQLSETKNMNDKLMKIIENSYDGIFVTDGKALATMMNKSYEKITGLKREDLIGRYMQDIVNKGEISTSASLKVLIDKKAVTLEQTFRSGRKALVSSSPIFDESGKIVNIITNVRDVTELYELKNQLAINEELKNKYFSEIETIKSKLMEGSDIIANDKVMLDTLRVVKKVAKVDTTILLLGETGVGKEELAKYVHKNSSRANGHFIKINCGAIPANLIESELFGYEQGSFTGAKKEGKMGYFQVADKGTIFLDEIGDLPLDMQVKILRVLQEQEIVKIGGTNPIKIDVRVLAATNRSLEDMVKRKLFRQDLYYRINVVPITIPPLRKRKRDIISLVEHFLLELNKKYDMKKTFSEPAIQAFMEYDWPGNVRELRNTVERVVILSSNDMIYKSDLPFKTSFDHECDDIDCYENIILKEKVERIELEYINNYYGKYKNVRSAAEALGMDASTLVRKREKYNKKYI